MTIIKKLEKISLREDRKKYLILSFSHEGKSYQKNLGKNTKERKKYALAILAKINADLIWGKFKSLSDYLGERSPSENTNKNFLILFQEFLTFREKSGLKFKTIEYDKTIAKNIFSLKKSITEKILDEKKIFLELSEITTKEMTRRSLIYIGQCLKHHKIDSYQDFYDMAQRITPSKKINSEKNKPVALTENEIIFLNQEILKAPYHKDKYYIFNFWLNTGCRPSQALAVRFCDVDFSKNKIFFRGSFQQNNFSEGSKKNITYSIPMSKNLRKILIEYFEKKIPNKNTDLIFPFSQNLESYRKFFKFLSKLLGKNFTAYNCRDTFITQQIKKGIPTAVIAKWCDNSISEIEKKYFDNSHLDIIPE
jgi:integrase